MNLLILFNNSLNRFINIPTHVIYLPDNEDPGLLFCVHF
jgi:hypothetical protein